MTDDTPQLVESSESLEVAYRDCFSDFATAGFWIRKAIRRDLVELRGDIGLIEQVADKWFLEKHDEQSTPRTRFAA